MHLEAIIIAILGVLGTVGAGLGVRFLERRSAGKTAEAAVTTAEASASAALASGFKTLMEGERAYREELLERFSAERKDLGDKIAQLTGVCRDMDQHIISLETLLRNQGLDIPERRFPHPILHLVSSPSD